MTDPITIPHSRESEEAVLGSVLFNPDVFPELMGSLRANDFYIHRCRFVWDAFERLTRQGIAIDVITTGEALRQAGHLDEIGGQAYLVGLLNAVGTSLHADSYARMVRAAAVRRKMLRAASRIAEYCYDESREIDATYAESLKLLGQAGHDLGTDTNVTTISQAIREHFDQDGPSDERILATNWTALDKLLEGGLTPGLHIPAGRPGTGKSVFMTNLAATWCKAGLRGALFSLEMNNRQNTNRIIANVAGIQLNRVKRKTLLDEDWPPYVQAIETIDAWDLAMHYTPVLTPEKLRATCLRLAAERPLDFVIVDYIQLMSVDGFSDKQNRVQELSYITRHLKQLSGELNCPLVAASQLSRAVENRSTRRPNLADLRESGSLEQDADNVIFLWTGRDYSDTHAVRPEKIAINISLAKQRGGNIGDFQLNLHGKYARMENPKITG
jgi:replicative DNA helicase